jgi:integrase/recombinase XerD
MAWVPDLTKFLTEPEIDRLRLAAKEKAEKSGVYKTWWMYLDLATRTGFRVNELRNLKVNDCFLDGHSFLRTIGKGKKKRHTMIPSDLRDHLLSFIQENELKENDFVLLSSHNKPFTRRALQKVFKKIAALAGLDKRFSIHSLRHSYASHLYQSTKDLRLVQKQLGHSSPSVTAIYADLSQEQISRTLDDVFKP